MTGYSGVVIGRAQHITNCNTYGLQKKADDKGSIEDAKWFDEPRIELMAEVPKLANRA